MTLILSGTLGVSPVTPSGTSSSIDGMTVGRGAGEVSTNTAVGASALAANTTGAYNTVVGALALDVNTTGNYNQAFGYSALGANTTGEFNSVIGMNAMVVNTTGSKNIAVGHDALGSNTTASSNTAVGYQAGYSNTTSAYNNYFGGQAGYSQTTGGANTGFNNFFGYQSGYAATSDLNTFIGNQSGKLITSGGKNTILGCYNGNQGGLDIRTSSNNIVLSDGDGNVCAWRGSTGFWQFGFGTGDCVQARNTSTANTTNSLFVGYYGSTGPSTGSLSFNVTTNGNVTNTNNSYGAVSDIKLKENITDATPKLEKLCQVRVVNYNFKEGQTKKQIGVIAQELEQVFPGMVEESLDRDAEGNELGTTTKSVKYSVFVPMLVKAIQELKAEFDAYKVAHP